MGSATLPGPSLLAELRILPKLGVRPYLVLEELYERYGPVVRVGRGPARLVLLLGAEANEVILKTAPGKFRWRDATKGLIPVDGETALVVSDGEEHARRRRLVQPAFGVKRIEGHLPTIVEELGAAIDRWPDGATVDIAASMQGAVRRIVIRSLFGDRLLGRADDLGDHLQPVLDYVNRPPLRRFDHKVPGSAFARAMRAKGRADAVVFEEIAARRANPTGRHDVLSALVSARDEETGSVLSDDEIRDQVLSLIAAGYDTTSAGVAWTLRAACADPAVRDRARAEVERVAGSAPLTIEHLAAMDYLDAVVRESLRLWPPGPISGRGVADEVEVAGHLIPQNTLVLYSAYLTHRLPELWSEPLRFLPERWIEGSAHFSEPVPYSFVAFGGGYRRCIGFALATLEIKAALAETLRRVDLQIEGPEPAPTGLATMSPRGGVRAVVARR